jgi:Tol biopolymer transport system component
MRTPEYTISLADLSAAGLRLHPSEAVAVARDVTMRAESGDLPGIPSANVIRFKSDGTIAIEGPIVAGRSVERAARLLDAMLPGFDAPPELRAPGALRLVIARALGTLDLPAYRSLDEFAAALGRFSAPDPVAAMKDLVETWAVAVSREAGPVESPVDTSAAGASSDLTISDVRRARRSTGLTLSDISVRSRIPVSLLRELEWGYFVNWPAGHYGRAQLVRYARAAGLDDQVVLGAVWPVLQEAARLRGSSSPIVDGAIVADLPLDNTSLVKIESAVPAVRAGADPTRRRRLAAAGAIAALMIVGLVPAIWNSGTTDEEPVPPAAQAATTEAPQESGQIRPGAERPDQTATAAQTAIVSRDSTEARRARPEIATSGQEEPLLGGPAPQPAALRADAAFSPAFATTGSAMFYHSDAGESSAIMRADTDPNGAVLRVTSIVDDKARNFHARPSPDGSQIAFDSDRDGERAVYVADASGSNVRRVTGDGFAAVPSWSPNGRYLAFVRAEPDRPRVWNLWTVDLETGETTRLTSHPVGQPWGAAWFPDGQRIAYSHEDRLIIRSLDGSSQRIYPSPRKGRLVRTPAVSPDGRRVIFQLYRNGAWMLDVSDGSMIRILEDPTAEEFTWAPDGRRVAYHSRKSGVWNVWVMAAR